jgi:chloramphenicol-sensitive protein RarD
MSEATKALIAALLAFTCWGLFPLYWKIFPEVSGESLFIQRLFWSMLTLSLLIPLTGKWNNFVAIFKDRRRWWLLLSAILIASNWLIYVVAVTRGHILEASLGYFLNPLINVVVGWMFLKENLRALQWPAVVLAVVGVVWMVVSAGLASFPWVALSLSITFAFYGLIRKLTQVGSFEGLSYETTVVFLPFLLWWLWRGGDVREDFLLLGPSKSALLALSGVITCLPLVLFAYASRRMPLQTLGFTQYLSPSFKFLCGWAVFHEPMPASRWQGFMFIWAGLIWYSIEQISNKKRLRPKLSGAPLSSSGKG